VKKFRIVFWLNTLSPHQLPYILELKKDKRVTEIVINVGEEISHERIRMGWTNDFDVSDNYFINPDESHIKSCYEKDEVNSIHFFSGIRGFEFVYKCFKTSLKYNVKRGLITEAPYTYAFNRGNGKPLILHKLRFLLQDRKYIPAIDYIFAIGNSAFKYYKSLSDQWNVIPFIYCTKTPDNVRYVLNENKPASFIFIGSMSDRKNPIAVLKAQKYLQNTKEFRTNFLGAGSELEKCREYAARNYITHTEFLGSKKMNEIQEYLNDSDVLILPSKYDGWGAVVNEALSSGLFVICSDQCGAKDLIKHKINGIVYKEDSLEALLDAMKWSIDDISAIRSERKNRIKSAEDTISGKVIAKYFLDSIEKAGIPPWK
jgi:glycosyltransferase involved in cell wall biosynthesis